MQLDRENWSFELYNVFPFNVSCVLSCLSDDEYRNYDTAKRALFRQLGIPVESDRKGQGDEQRVPPLEVTERQPTVEVASGNGEHAECDVAEPSEVKHVKSEAVACLQTGAIPESVPCEDEAGSSCHEKINEALETCLVPLHMGERPESSKVDLDSGAAEQSTEAAILDPTCTVGEGLAKEIVFNDSAGKLARQYREPDIALNSSFGECAFQASTESESAAIPESAPCGDEACSSNTNGVNMELDTDLVPRHLSGSRVRPKVEREDVAEPEPVAIPKSVSCGDVPESSNVEQNAMAAEQNGNPTLGCFKCITEDRMAEQENVVRQGRQKKRAKYSAHRKLEKVATPQPVRQCTRPSRLTGKGFFGRLRKRKRHERLIATAQGAAPRVKVRLKCSGFKLVEYARMNPASQTGTEEECVAKARTKGEGLFFPRLWPPLRGREGKLRGHRVAGVSREQRMSGALCHPRRSARAFGLRPHRGRIRN